jgi:hypothetical protein
MFNTDLGSTPLLKRRCLKEVNVNAKSKDIAMQIRKEDANMTFENMCSLETHNFGQNILTVEEAVQKIPLDGEVMFRLESHGLKKKSPDSTASKLSKKKTADKIIRIRR